MARNKTQRDKRVVDQLRSTLGKILPSELHTTYGMTGREGQRKAVRIEFTMLDLIEAIKEAMPDLPDKFSAGLAELTILQFMYPEALPKEIRLPEDKFTTMAYLIAQKFSTVITDEEFTEGVKSLNSRDGVEGYCAVGTNKEAAIAEAENILKSVKKST